MASRLEIDFAPYLSLATTRVPVLLADRDKTTMEREGIRTREGEGRRVPSSQRQARCKRKTRRLATFNESEWNLRFRKGKKRIGRGTRVNLSSRNLFAGKRKRAKGLSRSSKSRIILTYLDLRCSPLYASRCIPPSVYGRVRGLYTRSGVRRTRSVSNCPRAPVCWDIGIESFRLC